MDTNLASERSEHAVDEKEVVGVHARKQEWYRGKLRMGLRGGGSGEEEANSSIAKASRRGFRTDNEQVFGKD